MNLVKFEDSRYEAFVTSKDINVELVLKYLRETYSDEFTYDPELPYDNTNVVVYNNTENYYIKFKKSYIEEM